MRRPAATLVLLGFVGRDGWPNFAAAAEARDGHADPAGPLVASGPSRPWPRISAAMALFPFGGPPWLPFGRWALRSGEVFSSPLGILIHPQWGLWHSYRGALAFAERLALPEPGAAGSSPCTACDAKPCLHTCPVSAFSGEGYAVAACRSFLGSAAGVECVGAGCRARRACPVGSEHRYGAEQTAFLMRAFMAG